VPNKVIAHWVSAARPNVGMLVAASLQKGCSHCIPGRAAKGLRVPFFFSNLSNSGILITVFRCVLKIEENDS